MDTASFQAYLPDDFNVDFEKKTLTVVKETMDRAATTKLEYKLVKALVEIVDATICKSKFTSAELSFARTYRLRYQDTVHPSVLLLRNTVFANAAEAERVSDRE